MLRDRAQAVVTGEPAAVLHLETSEVEVALVVDDEHVAGLDLEERGGSADGATRLVHIRLRLEQDELLVSDLDLRDLPGELRAPRAAVPPRQLVDDEIAGVVAVPRVLAARVAEARDEKDGLALDGAGLCATRLSIVL